MVTPITVPPSEDRVYKSEQSKHVSERLRPGRQATDSSRAIPIESLRTFEEKLQSRGLIKSEALSFGSLWFLVETEKNVFLWRRGLSLSAEESFRFYVDVPALVQKRLNQIELALASGADTPFLNPLWSVSPSNLESLDLEREYLKTFSTIWSKVEEHMLALKLVIELIETKSVKDGSLDRETVLLGG